MSQRRLSSTTSSADGELPLDRGKLGKYRSASVGRACQYSTAVRRKQAQLGDTKVDQCGHVIACSRVAFRWQFSAGQFHGVLRELDTLLTAEQRQQHQHALVRSSSGIETEVSGERTLQNPHLLAHVKHFAFWKPDQPVTLARSDLVDRAVGHARWLRTIEHSANHAGRPAGGVPLKLDGDEAVPGKQWRCD